MSLLWNSPVTVLWIVGIRETKEMKWGIGGQMPNGRMKVESEYDGRLWFSQEESWALQFNARQDPLMELQIPSSIK